MVACFQLAFAGIILRDAQCAGVCRNESLLTSISKLSIFNMHPHLHTKDNQGQLSHWPFFVHELTFLSACEEVMAILDECHARGFMWKAMGMCNTAKTDVNKCLRAQRLERTKANREAAKIKTEKRKAMFAEIDQNS
jgi:COX assembly protein 2